MFNSLNRVDSYGKDYFIGEYRKQYGRTYEEDFQAISAVAGRRLDRIFTMLRTVQRDNLPTLSLLDIGSALGFFLNCARERGIETVRGVEISRYAADYCRNRFSISVDTAPFPDKKPSGSYDIITAWYFIEHTQSPIDTLRIIFSMINPGGVLAFSAPSIRGPMYIFHRNRWIEERPADHRIDFSPRAIRNILTDIGYSTIKILPAGFHPERLLPESSLFFRPFSALYRWFSKLAVFSDTVEVYARK